MCSRTDGGWYNENLASLDAYLLGATLFRYPRVLGDRYRRAELSESLAAAVQGHGFPLRRIVEVARAENT